MGPLSFLLGCVDKYELDSYREKGWSVYTSKGERTSEGQIVQGKAANTAVAHGDCPVL